MDDGRTQRDDTAELPAARVNRRHWSAMVIWIVPLVAALVAGYLIWGSLKDRGPEITIRFRDGSGIKVGQTPILYRGVQVGEVTGVGLSKDQRHVDIKARLQRNASALARDGAVFWVVRPEVGIGSITGLGTVITGPEIQSLPGSGEQKNEFDGLDIAPAALELRGLKVVLRTDRLGSLQRNSPVYYRGVEVGVVQEARLSPDATGVHVHVLIRQRYATLVRANSVFWNVSGVSLSGGIFKGVQFKLESLRSLAAGGINFATPNDSGRQAQDGQVFPLHADGRKEWMAWAPSIRLPEPREDEPLAPGDARRGETPPAKAQEKNSITPGPGKKSAPKAGKTEEKAITPRFSEG